METAVGIFASREDALSVARKLESSLGFADKNLVVLSPGAATSDVETIPSEDAEQPGMGKALGGVVGSAEREGDAVNSSPMISGDSIGGTCVRTLTRANTAMQAPCPMTDASAARLRCAGGGFGGCRAHFAPPVDSPTNRLRLVEPRVRAQRAREGRVSRLTRLKRARPCW